MGPAFRAIASTAELICKQRLADRLKQSQLLQPARAPSCRRCKLRPPGLSAGAEVSLSPWREQDDAAVGHVRVGQGQGQGGGATHDLALGVVLGAVAGALELVLGRCPGHDATQVGAHSVDAVRLNAGAVLGGHQVGGVTLQALGQLAGAGLGVALQPLVDFDVRAQDVLGGLATAATTTAGGHEEEGERAGHGHGRQAHTTGQHQVHDVPLAHVGHILSTRGTGSAHGLHGPPGHPLGGRLE
mmetsp:Transcript_19267/g.53941  ORF Transcript_19267/g.53941 Transcript_19267/m.53941 type:complete len:243 (+) Transcript_19267:380-1108(+)